MGRISTFTAFATLAAAMVSAPAMAQDTGISCIENAYTAEQVSAIGAASQNLANGTQLNQSALNEIVMVASPAIQACAAQSGWNEQQTMFATFYEMGRVSEQGFRASGLLTPNELARLDEGLAQDTSGEVWAAVESTVMASLGGTVSVSNDDALTMGLFITGIGLDVGSAGTDTPELVGMLLGFMGLQRIGTREFANASN